MIPPRGYNRQDDALIHRFNYTFGLSTKGGTLNTTIVPLVKSYKTTVDPSTIQVNNHNSLFQVETGAVCQRDSIINDFSLYQQFNLTDSAMTTNNYESLSIFVTPIFFSFREKLDSADMETTTTLLSLLNLTADDTQEDVVPTFTVGADLTSSGTYPYSSVNLVETKTEAGLDTGDTFEGVAFNQITESSAKAFYTNKGALKSILGNTRRYDLRRTRPVFRSFVKRPVPKSIRTMMEFGFFAMRYHVPLYNDVNNPLTTQGVTTSLADVGVTGFCKFHEWNKDFDQSK